MTSFTGFVPLSSGAEDSPVRRISSVNPRLTRTNYEDGRLLRASDLVRDQFYLEERLREVGRVVGQGIVSGLDPALSADGRLTVTPGSAVAPSGRVLSLDDGLTINLFDAARIAALNPELFTPLPRGLYVVALRLAVRGGGVAEVFPADLSAERTFRYDHVEEGVEVVLVPLPLRLATLNRRGGSRFQERAALARQLLSNPGQPPELSGDAVALALLFFDEGRPVWLDEGLVRRDFRAPAEPNQSQRDLLAFTAALMEEIIADRNARGVTGPMRASSVFDVLPPAGPMPADAVDAAGGLQTFFPPHYDVAVAPVRLDDLPVLVEEALALDPLEMSSAAPAEVVVLAPLPDTLYARYARQLEFDPNALATRERAYRDAVEALEDGTLADASRALEAYERYVGIRAGDVPERLPSLGALTLRARRVGPVDALDTDAAVWRDVMAAVDGPLWYVRRAPRAADTAVSAVVLARGYAVPEPGEEPGADTESLERDLAEANARLAELTARVGEQDTEIERLREALDEAGEAEIADLQREVAELTARLERAQEEAAAVPGLRARVEELEAALRDAQAEIERLREAAEDTGEADRLRAEITRLQGVVADLRRRIAELEGAGPQIRLRDVVAGRRIDDPRAREAAGSLVDRLAGDPQRERTALAIVSLVPSRYEPALWPTLDRVAEAGTMRDMLDLVRETAGADGFGERMAERLVALDVPSDLARQWAALGEGGAGPSGGGLRLRSVPALADERDIRQPDVRNTIRELDRRVAGDRAVLAFVNQAVDSVPPRYDAVLWDTLGQALESGQLPAFAATVSAAAARGERIGRAVAEEGERLALPRRTLQLWQQLDP